MRTRINVLICLLSVSFFNFNALALELTINENTSLEKVVDYSNEFDVLRATTRLFPNQQGTSHGVQLGYVNTSSGNATFVMRDLVVNGKRPIVLSRVYDSGKSSRPKEFGAGWSLGANEKVFKNRSGLYVLKDETGTKSLLQKVASNIEFVEDELLIHHDGERKRFTLSGETYFLVSVTDVQDTFAELSIERDQNMNVQVIRSGSAWIKLSYDRGGKIVAASDSQGRTIQFEYRKSKLVSSFDIGGVEWKYAYTDKNKLKSLATQEDQIALKLRYNNQGKVTKSSSHKGVYEFQWRKSRVVVTGANEETIQLTHDEVGRLKRVQNSLGVSKLKYEDGELSQYSRDDGTSYEVVSNGGSDSTTRLQSPDFGSNVIRRVFNPQGKLESIFVNGEIAHSFEYSNDGELLKREDTKLGRTIEFDRRGRVVGLTDEEAKYRIAYDTAGQISEVRDDGELTAWYEYFDDGKLKNVHVMDAATVSFEYDERGLLKKMSNAIQGETTFFRSENGTLEKSETVKGDVTSVEVQEHDRFGRTMEVTSKKGSELTSHTKFKRNRQGDVVEAQILKEKMEFSYDDRRRLTRVETNEEPSFVANYDRDDLDIRATADRKAVPAQSEFERPSASFPKPGQVHTYSMGSAIGGLIFVESLADLVIADPSSGLPGDDAVNALLRSRQLVKQDDGPRMGFIAAASNTQTFPGEYYSVNCNISISFNFFMLYYTMFIPYDNVKTPGVGSLVQVFAGDNRNTFSGAVTDTGYRAQHLLLVVIGDSVQSYASPGTAKEYDESDFSGTNCILCTTASSACSYAGTFPVTSGLCRGSAQPTNTGVATDIDSMTLDGVFHTGNSTAGTTSFNFRGSPKNPLAIFQVGAIFAPAIDYLFGITLTRNVVPIFLPTYTFAGSHDGFPAHSLQRAGQGTLYFYDPRSAGKTPSSLYGSGDESASGSGLF